MDSRFSFNLSLSHSLKWALTSVGLSCLALSIEQVRRRRQGSVRGSSLNGCAAAACATSSLSK